MIAALARRVSGGRGATGPGKVAIGDRFDIGNRSVLVPQSYRARVNEASLPTEIMAEIPTKNEKGGLCGPPPPGKS